MPILQHGESIDLTIGAESIITIRSPNGGMVNVESPIGTRIWAGAESDRKVRVKAGVTRITAAERNVFYEVSFADVIQPSESDKQSIGDYNSFTIYEEFDKALGDLFAGAMTGITTGTTSSSGMTATFTANAIQNDLAGVNGAMYYNSGASQAASSHLRYHLHGGSPGRMLSMFRNGFRAEMRFALEVAEPNRFVQFGWLARASAATTDGLPGGAGTLIIGQTAYLIRRDVDAGVQRKDEIATLAVGKVYTISADTTSGQLVHTITNNTDGVVVDTRTVPKWTGYQNMVNDMDLFGSTPSNAKFQVWFGVVGGLHTLTVPAVTRLLTMDAFYVHCPRLR